MPTVALIGAGALSHIFCRHFDRVLTPHYRLTGIYSRTAAKAQTLAAQTGTRCFESLQQLCDSHPDFIVELAGAELLRQSAVELLTSGAHLVIVSTGALADPALKSAMEQAARRSGRKLYIASGALGGLDLMRTFALMGEQTLRIENCKAPKSFLGAPYLQGREPSAQTEECLFTGAVQQAIAGFPKNVNVAVTAALASEVPEAQVRIFSDPATRENTHRVYLSNPLMHAELTITSRPDPNNPKSSTSTAWSVLALLKNLAEPVSFF